jgi:glucose-fructose oxidoreductase
VKIAYTATIDGKEESKTFPETDHFGGETEYFSDCILNNVDPEADGEEGLLDVRVIVAIKDSLKGNGKTIKLEPRRRSKYPTLNQVKKLSLAKEPNSFIGRDSQKPSTDL